MPQNQLTCQICGQSFSSSELLQNHRRTQHQRDVSSDRSSRDADDELNEGGRL